MLTDPERREWEIIVIGTGMGGATLGYALAKAGKQVLFCEQGNSHLNRNFSMMGSYPESFFDHAEVPQLKHRETLTRAGRWTDEIEDRSFNRPHRFIPFIGAGTGGSTALYGMALERLFPCDFTPRENYPSASDSTLPATWPITYAELSRYYEDAERLFRVRGTTDPKRIGEKFAHFLEPPPLSPAAHELYEFFIQNGLHPYRLPQACEYVTDCQCCQGYLCAKNCKNDSAKICLQPAITEFNASLIDNCKVLKLEASRTSVLGVTCSWGGRRITLRGSLVVLAAGALNTPAILLNSACAVWPNGLANDSGLVGKNLMRHHVDLYAVFPRTKEKPSPLKEFALNDFYQAAGQKFGTVQTFGALPPTPIITAGMEQQLRDKSFAIAASVFGCFKPVINRVLNRLFSRSIIIASIMEDLPHQQNSVMPAELGADNSPDRLLLKYTISEHDRARISLLRNRLRSVLKPYHVIVIKQAENNERIAHACGTCRFGSDPSTSVLDSANRVHGIENLYVVDSSFFPSSGGTNPALTIAANALRVADHILVMGSKKPSMQFNEFQP